MRRRVAKSEGDVVEGKSVCLREGGVMVKPNWPSVVTHRFPADLVGTEDPKLMLCCNERAVCIKNLSH